MKCYFCGNSNSKIEVNKVFCKGKNNGKEVTKDLPICICCNAQTDNEWISEKLGWDNVNSIENIQ